MVRIAEEKVLLKTKHKYHNTFIKSYTFYYRILCLNFNKFTTYLRSFLNDNFQIESTSKTDNIIFIVQNPRTLLSLMLISSIILSTLSLTPLKAAGSGPIILTSIGTSDEAQQNLKKKVIFKVSHTTYFYSLI